MKINMETAIVTQQLTHKIRGFSFTIVTFRGFHYGLSHKVEIHFNTIVIFFSDNINFYYIILILGYTP